MIKDETCTSISVSGRVQGVCYRAFAQKQAIGLGISGWVKNMSDGSVYLEVGGSRVAIEKLIEALKRGPLFARVDQVEVDWFPYDNKFSGFEVRY